MKVLLATLHAKYVHSSLALPCLAAACAGLGGITTVIREFTVNEPPDQVLRQIVAERAAVVALSCYIWNIGPTLRLVADLKKVLPKTFVILGGPEVSYGSFELLEHNQAVDFIIKGEGEDTFRELVTFLARSGWGRDVLQYVSTEMTGIIFYDGNEIVATSERPPIVNLDSIPSPFAAGLADLAKPLVYYETSRGCPFSCAFCMSSLEPGVRSFSMERIKADLTILMEHGVQTIKLVDRTFNFDAERANAIWQFILRTNRASRFHFEIAADLLTEENLRLLAQVPGGLFRFEIGIQSGEEETLARVGRHSDLARLFANVQRLVETTGVTVHLDLVAGLPGEDYGGFLRSLQSLLDVKPQHIQVETLKVLKGSAMRRIALDEGYAFSGAPPYKILNTPWLTFPEITAIEEIARLLDLFYNSGRFRTTLAVLAETAPLAQVFTRFAASLGQREPVVGSSLTTLFELLWTFGREFTAEEGREILREALCYDYCLAEYPVAGRLPRFLPEQAEPAEQRGEREKPASLARRLGIGKESRIRTFSQRFAWDFRRQPAEQRDVSLRFVYIATPGKGFEVMVQAGRG
jgi:anaerobic magnesium-protoporphyrin IX monomethyl ester cyclase